jgi:hypothetical protein
MANHIRSIVISMRPKRRPQRFIAALSACCVFYFWGAWTLHSLLDDAKSQGDRDDKLLTSAWNGLSPDGHEPVLPAPPSDGTFSACLLVMDDNHFLIEWLVSSVLPCVLYTVSDIRCSLVSHCRPSFVFRSAGLSLPHASSEASHCCC